MIGRNTFKKQSLTLSKLSIKIFIAKIKMLKHIKCGEFSFVLNFKLHQITFNSTLKPKDFKDTLIP